MMGRTHIIIGISAGVAYLPAVTQGELMPGQFGFIMVGLVIGSLLPDIDHPHSLISQQLPIVGRVISALTRHRGLFHSILGVLVMAGLSAWWSVGIAQGLTSLGIQNAPEATHHIGLGLMIGYILHILADMITVRGVRLFYPLKFTVRIPLFSTGGFREWLLGLALMFGWVLRIVTLLSK